MARKKQSSAAPQFLIVWHDQPRTVIVGSNRKDLEDLVIPAGFRVVADDVWETVPHFVRDVQNGALHTERSGTVPVNREMKVSSQYESYLTPNQVELAKLICTTDSPLPPQVLENINLHKLMGPGGVPRQGVKVTRKFLTENHRPFLQATIEMEAQHRNRPDVLKVLMEAVSGIDSL